MPFAKSHSPESLLQLLQRYIKYPNKFRQIHSLLVTTGCLHLTSQWMNTLLYNTLIRAYLNLALPQTVLLLFTQMLSHQALPNSHTFPSLIKAAASLSSPSPSHIGKILQAQSLKRGTSTDPFVQTSFINFYAQCGDTESAKGVFAGIPKPCIVTYNALIDGFVKNGEMALALLTFSSMNYRDVYTWTSMINGYAKHKRFKEAIELFEEMIFEGLVKPNEATFVSTLSSCANLDGSGVLCRGKEVHGYMVKNERELSVYMGTALIAFYGKMGSLEYASRIFNTMVAKEVCTWNAMISSLALNGEEKWALEIFRHMRAGQVCPNEVTFVGVLCACARAKFVDLGLKLFCSMSDFGLVPRMEHYGCVVDLLGRAGLLKEAYDFIRSMPFEADASVLGALIGACRVHGAVELGNEAGRWLLKLQPQHCGRYVQLSSLYAGAERWDCAALMRKAMVDAGVRKVPAYSVIYPN